MFFSRGREGWRRVAQPFLVSNTVHGAAWCLVTGERRGAASAPSSSFFAGLVQDLPSPFLSRSIHPFYPPAESGYLSLSFSHRSFLSVSCTPRPCTKPVRSFVRPFLATISTSARLRLDIDIHWRMPPLEYSLLEAASLLLCPRVLPCSLDLLARSLAWKVCPSPHPFSSTFHFSTVRPRARPLLNTVNNRRKEPLPVCKPCIVRPWLRFTYRRGNGPMRAAFNRGCREICRIPGLRRHIDDGATRERSRFLNIPIG